MQEALDRHFQGIEYRERNAGQAIDEHMTDNGVFMLVWKSSFIEAPFAEERNIQKDGR